MHLSFFENKPHQNRIKISDIISIHSFEYFWHSYSKFFATVFSLAFPFSPFPMLYNIILLNYIPFMFNYYCHNRLYDIIRKMCFSVASHFHMIDSHKTKKKDNNIGETQDRDLDTWWSYKRAYLNGRWGFSPSISNGKRISHLESYGLRRMNYYYDSTYNNCNYSFYLKEILVLIFAI